MGALSRGTSRDFAFSIAEGEKPQSGKVKLKKYIAEGVSLIAKRLIHTTFHFSLLSFIWKSRPDTVEKREERRVKR